MNHVAPGPGRIKVASMGTNAERAPWNNRVRFAAAERY
jgi:hypothetical protein